MRLLLDEDAGWLDLKKALVAAGHDVVRSVDILGNADSDEDVLEKAIVSRLIRAFFDFDNVPNVVAVRISYVTLKIGDRLAKCARDPGVPGLYAPIELTGRIADGLHPRLRPEGEYDAFEAEDCAARIGDLP